jgi:hypothetical protein
MYGRINRPIVATARPCPKRCHRSAATCLKNTWWVHQGSNLGPLIKRFMLSPSFQRLYRQACGSACIETTKALPFVGMAPSAERLDLRIRLGNPLKSSMLQMRIWQGLPCWRPKRIYSNITRLTSDPPLVAVFVQIPVLIWVSSFDPFSSRHQTRRIPGQRMSGRPADSMSLDCARVCVAAPQREK